MSIDELKRSADDNFSQGHRLKEEARKSNADINLFKTAAESYSKAANIHLELQQKDLPDEDLFQSKTYYFYYKHEEFDCLYGYEIKYDLEKAKQYVIESNKFILSAIDSVEGFLNKLNGDLKDRFSGLLKGWKYKQLVTKAKIFEPDAKNSSRKGEFVAALDFYKKMLRIYKEAVDYCIKDDIEEVYRRISEGCYFGLCVNISQMYAGTIYKYQATNTTKIDLDMDLLKHFLDAYQFSLIAFDSNPEWLEYREGQEVLKKNIEILLNKNKDKWITYLIETDNNNELIKLMKNIDYDTYKRISAKQEIESDELKKLYFTGGFYVTILLIVFGIVFFIFNSAIPFYYKPLTIFFIIILFSVIGAFILRSTKSLSEDNFIKLMTLSLKIGVKGLNSLDKKEEK